MPDCKEEVKMKERAIAIWGASIFSSRLGRPSGPAALFTFRPLSSFSTPGGVMVKSGITGIAVDVITGNLVSSSLVKTDLKYEFRSSHLATASEIS